MCIYCVAALVVFVSHLIVFIGDPLDIFRWEQQCAFSTVSRIAFSLSLTLWMWPRSRCEHQQTKKSRAKWKCETLLFYIYFKLYIYRQQQNGGEKTDSKKKLKYVDDARNENTNGFGSESVILFLCTRQWANSVLLATHILVHYTTRFIRPRLPVHAVTENAIFYKKN